jgi:hypothetical protein
MERGRPDAVWEAIARSASRIRPAERAATGGPRRDPCPALPASVPVRRVGISLGACLPSSSSPLFSTTGVSCFAVRDLAPIGSVFPTLSDPDPLVEVRGEHPAS